MNRLTAVDGEELIDCAICPDDDCYLCANILNAIERLRNYENLESELEKVYGECDGLLEESVKYLVEHDGIDLDNPGKARLLTDGNVDKWLRWKELSEKGRLLELPCAVGDKVYCLYVNDEDEEYVQEMKAYSLDWVVCNRREFGKLVFLDKQSAERRLVENKNDRKRSD